MTQTAPSPETANGTAEINGTADTNGTVLELRGVTKTFKDFWLRPRVKAVQDVDLTIRRGEVIGLLGPNGSGKTTTIKMILGLLNPTGGQIAVLGKRPSDVKLKHRVGYLPEESHLYRFLNAEETLDFYGRLFRIPGSERKGRVESLLDMGGLTAARYRPVGEYSKGMQRRVGLAQALINDPDLLILDEPTTGMDPIATRQIKDLIRTLKSRGKTVILCTHLLGEVEDICDRLVIMYGGKIRAQGTVDELLTIDGKQQIEVTGGPIDDETARQLSAALSSQGRTVEAVHAPREKLENLFLQVIDQATAGGERTTGAAVGGEVAGFLNEGDAPASEGDALLDSLSATPAAQPEPVQAVEPEPVATQDDAVLEEISSTKPPEPEPTAPAPTPERKASDDTFLSDLSKK
jgi:ABC-2 type transport system ATP-binding protein